MSKTIVVYHRADYDGIFCREIARKFLPDAELIGWDFGDPAPNIPFQPGDPPTIYILDLPCDRIFGFDFAKAPPTGDTAAMFKNVIWIDHHKSSIESHPTDIPGYRIDGVAACRLAWQWFAGNHHGDGERYGLPKKKDFIDRKTSRIGREEPEAVRLAGEYDVWDKRDPDADIFQFGLRSQELDGCWPALLADEATATIAEIEDRLTHGSKFELLPNGNIKVPGLGDRVVKMLLKNGKLLQAYQQSNDAGMMSRSFLVEFEGLKFLTLTTARCNSLTFRSKDVPETGHDALMGFYYNGSTWTVSMYHAKHRTDLDLSAIAVKHGGGGHRGACGFSLIQLPFIK